MKRIMNKLIPIAMALILGKFMLSNTPYCQINGYLNHWLYNAENIIISE